MFEPLPGDLEPSSDPESGGNEARLIRVRVPGRVEGEAHFSNHVLANFTGTEFVVTFAQVIPPPILPGDSVPEYIQQGFIDATVIGRFVVPADKFVEMSKSWTRLIAALEDKGRLPRSREEARHDAAS